jgi:fimbrial chaperone protein
MMDRLNRKAVLGTAFLVFFASFPAASPAAMAVSPLRVDLSDGNTKGAIQVSNQDDKPRSYQVEIVAWSQTDEQRELYTPTEDLIAVPPLFTLEPGESQQVRVGMLAAADSVVERSYRMFITELEPPRKKGEQKVGLTMRMQIGVPVFVEPGSAEPEVGLEYVGLVQKDDQTFVRFHNDGNIHVKVIEARFKARGSEDWLNQTAVFYMLPGNTGLLPVALPEGASAGTMVIITDGQDELTYELAEAT